MVKYSVLIKAIKGLEENRRILLLSTGDDWLALPSGCFGHG